LSKSNHKPILAIDFGTSNSLVGCVYNGQKQMALPIDEHSSDATLMRTLLYFPEPDICYYGQDAIQKFLDNDLEGRLFRSFKAHLPNQGYLGTVFNNRVLTLEVLVGLFLLELRKRAEKILGEPVEKVVMGRPARYSMDAIADGFALHRMEKAVKYAGFKEVQFVPEPLAAAFDFRRHARGEKIILIGDFGGGTSDFTVMKIHPNQFSNQDVLSIEGCPHAGDSLDSVFMSNKLNEYFGAKTKYRLPMSSNVLSMPPAIMMRLNNPAHIVHLKDKESYEFIKEVEKCALTTKDVKNLNRLFALIEDNQIFPFFEHIEKSKRDLSLNSSAQFSFDYPDVEIEENFSIQQFTNWSEDIRYHIFQALDRSLLQSGLKPEQIDLVCLTGGTSKVPLIRSEFERRFGRDKLQTQTEFHSVTSGLVEVADLWAQGQTVYSVTALG